MTFPAVVALGLGVLGVIVLILLVGRHYGAASQIGHMIGLLR